MHIWQNFLERLAVCVCLCASSLFNHITLMKALVHFHSLVSYRVFIFFSLLSLFTSLAPDSPQVPEADVNVFLLDVERGAYLKGRYCSFTTRERSQLFANWCLHCHQLMDIIISQVLVGERAPGEGWRVGNDIASPRSALCSSEKKFWLKFQLSW